MRIDIHPGSELQQGQSFIANKQSSITKFVPPNFQTNTKNNSIIDSHQSAPSKLSDKQPFVWKYINKKAYITLHNR